MLDAGTVRDVMLVVPAGEEGRKTGIQEGVAVVAGGASRSESVKRGLESVGSEFVVVHDAARPLVTAALIDECVGLLDSRPDADGVIAAAALTDTVKRAGGGDQVEETVSRDGLWAAQTPQVFRTEKLRAAMDADPQRLAAATDDAWLIEQAGGKVILHPNAAPNPKITTPTDLGIAGLLLGQRGQE